MSTASLLIDNAIGVPAMIGTVIFFVVGLLAPATRGEDAPPTAVAEW